MIFSRRFAPPFASALLALAVLPIAACGNDGAPDTLALDAVVNNESGIINGETCDETVHPTAVALLVEGTMDIFGFEQDIKQVVCTGTLIAPDVVLTAAHCVDPEAITGGFGELSSQRMFVTRTGDLSLIAGGMFEGDLAEQGVEAHTWVKHENFDINAFAGGVNGPGQYDDIAVMFLNETIDIAPMPVITAEEAALLTEDMAVDIAGWGQQDPNMGMFDTPPGTKQCGPSTLNELGEFEMQIGGDESTTRKCHGDSGGPTYVFLSAGDASSERVIGVTSHAYDETDCATGGVDTRVDAYLDFIDESMRAGCADASRVWCETPGIIPVDFVVEPAVVCNAELMSPEEGELFDDATSDVDPDTEGFQIEVTVRADDIACAGRPAQVLVNDETVFIEELDANGRAVVVITLADGDNTLVAQIGDQVALGTVAERTVTFDPADGPEGPGEEVPAAGLFGIGGCSATHSSGQGPGAALGALGLVALAMVRRRRVAAANA